MMWGNFVFPKRVRQQRSGQLVRDELTDSVRKGREMKIYKKKKLENKTSAEILENNNELRSITFSKERKRN